MKIVYISSSVIPSRTANSIHVMKMCQAFAVNKNEVLLLAPKDMNNMEKDVSNIFSFYNVREIFQLIRLPWIKMPGKSYIYALIAAIKASFLNPDLVYCRSITGCFFASIFGLSVVLELHSAEDTGKSLKTFFLKSVFKSSQLKKVVVITKSLKNYYEIKYPEISKHLYIGPDGADEINLNENPIKLKRNGNSLQVGYIGHLYKGRGVELLIALSNECDWVDFHFVGGKECDIKKWKEKTQTNSNIYFHGFVPQKELNKYFQSFDVLVAPYQVNLRTAGGDNTVNWMSPLKIFEYMASKKPIVCSDFPVIREVLRHEYNSILCPPDDMLEWKQSLEILKKDIGLRTKLANNAHEDFVNNYTWKVRAKKILESIDFQ